VIDELNKDVISAIERGSLKDALTTSWIRFESHARKIWERTHPNETLPDKGHAVILIDYVAELLGIPEQRVKLFHKARIERNEVQHPAGRKLKITIPQITNLLESTEQFIQFIPQ
jgi:hypothetical protein